MTTPEQRSERICSRFGANIRRRREELGLTQAQVAEAAAMTQQLYQRVERGVANMEILTAVRIASALRCKFHDLL